MPTAYDDYFATAQKQLAGQKNQSLSDLNALYNSQRDTLTSQYDTAVSDAQTAYEDQYRENAVQKLINEREVAENMANLGLTDSGLNRTQQTAVQLSYANNKGSIDRAKQAQLDALNQQRAQGLAEIEQNRLSGQNEINQYFTSLATQSATEAYNAAVEAELKQREAELQAALEREKLIIQQAQAAAEGQQKTTPYYKFLTTNDGGATYSFLNADGKKETYDAGINPYTGRRIQGYTQAQLNKYGVWNGYQPKGVVYNGTDYGAVKLADSLAVSYQGHDKNVWMTSDAKGRNIKYWVWDDYKNGGSYVRVYKRTENGNQYWAVEVDD